MQSHLGFACPRKRPVSDGRASTTDTRHGRRSATTFLDRGSGPDARRAICQDDTRRRYDAHTTPFRLNLAVGRSRPLGLAKPKGQVAHFLGTWPLTVERLAEVLSNSEVQTKITKAAKMIKKHQDHPLAKPQQNLPSGHPCKCGCGTSVPERRVFVNQDHQVSWLRDQGRFVFVNRRYPDRKNRSDQP